MKALGNDEKDQFYISLIYMVKIDSLWAIKPESQLDRFNATLDTLQARMDEIQPKTELLANIIDTSNSSIANQLSAANFLLAIIAIIVTAGGLILGYYISKKKTEIEELARIIDDNKRTVDIVAESTKKLDEQIKGNISELYRKLRGEETNALLDRLVLEPLDIGNLIYLLLSRDLSPDAFLKLREAYLKLEKETEKKPEENVRSIKLGPSSSDEYILLFFQHFCYDALKDDLIRPELVKSFNSNCRKAFKRDIIKTTIDLCKALSEETSTFNKEEVLKSYLKALNQCAYRNYADLKNILMQNIVPQSLLQKAIEQCENDGTVLALFVEKKDNENLEGERSDVKDY